MAQVLAAVWRYRGSVLLFLFDDFMLMSKVGVIVDLLCCPGWPLWLQCCWSSCCSVSLGLPIRSIALSAAALWLAVIVPATLLLQSHSGHRSNTHFPSLREPADFGHFIFRERPWQARTISVLISREMELPRAEARKWPSGWGGLYKHQTFMNLVARRGCKSPGFAL